MTTPIPVLPRHRTIFAVDIEGSTRRTNSGRGVLRNAMYDLLAEAMLLSGIAKQHRDLVDRGDGVLVLIHPVDDLPKTKLLNTVVPTLSDLLGQLQFERPEHSFRMRAAMHAGEVHWDGYGWYGEDIDITCRLLDAPEVKRKLTQTSAPLVLVVSQHIYLSVIRHGYDGIDNSTFEPIVQLEMGDLRQTGWVQVPAAVGRQGLTA
jgi:class 3 adenylate cyclase